MPKPIVIEPYDPEWLRTYEEERKLIRGVVGKLVRSLDHVGSTSVPDLWAKPTIDIIGGVDGRDDAERCRVLLEPLGYDDVSTGDDPDWYYCLGKGRHSPGFHLHLVREGSTYHLKHIIFRDWLRTHPADAGAYKELKIRLAEKYKHDRVAYTEGKTEFINKIVGKAKKSRT